MKLRYKDTLYDYPSSLSDVTVGQLIDYYHLYGKAQAKQIEEINELENEEERDVKMSILLINIYAESISFYTGIPLEELSKNVNVGDLDFVYYQSFQKSITEKPNDYQRAFTWNDEVWCLGDFELVPSSHRITNEFLSAKEVVRQLTQLKASSWEKILFLSCIYLRKKDEPFSEDLILESEVRLKMMRNLPADLGAQVAVFFDKHNDYLKENFTVFKKSATKVKLDMSALFERWGWVTFLSMLAKDNVFTVQGMNSIDSVKQTKLYDVLIYSSEKKDREDMIFNFNEKI